MTRKRLFVIAGILVSAACIVLVAIAMLPPRPGVTKANFDSIEIGMTKEDVTGILGENVTGPWKIMAVNHTYFSWWGTEGKRPAQANIFFDDDRVIDKWWFPSNETIAEKFQRWLHLP